MAVPNLFIPGDDGRRATPPMATPVAPAPAPPASGPGGLFPMPAPGSSTIGVPSNPSGGTYSGVGAQNPPTAGGGDVYAFIRQWQQSHPANQGIQSLVDALNAAGFNVGRWDVGGGTLSNNELNIGGQKFKVLSAENSGNPSWYVPGTDDGGGATQGGIASGAFLQPSALFKMPTVDEFKASPGYQAGLDAFTGQLENGAAAKGDLFTGGFQQDLAEKRTDYTLGKYGDFVDQLARIYGINFNTERANRNDPFEKLFGVTGLGFDAVGAANNSNLTASQFRAQGQQTAGNIGAAGTIGQAQGQSGIVNGITGLGLAALQRYQNRQRGNSQDPVGNSTGLVTGS